MWLVLCVIECEVDSCLIVDTSTMWSSETKKYKRAERGKHKTTQNNQKKIAYKHIDGGVYDEEGKGTRRNDKERKAEAPTDHLNSG